MTQSFDPDSVVLAPDHFINGRKVRGTGAAIAVTRPSDGAAIGEIHDAGEGLVDAAVTSSDAALRASAWDRVSPLVRSKVLHRWANLLEEHTEEFARLEAATSTRLISETSTRDVMRAAGAIRYFAEEADKLAGTVIATGPEATGMTLPEPYGIVAGITAWNFPLINAVWKSAPALAVGNAAVVKPSELTPFSAVRLAELAIEAGLPAGLFNVVQGGGRTTGSALVRHSLIRKISFTGSPETGQRIMVDAAETGTKPLTLELGGKSAQLVLSDVTDLDRVATHIASGFLANAGQVCTAGSRLIVPRGKADELISKVMALAAKRVAGPTWEHRTTLSPIVNRRQAERIQSMVHQSVAEGAEILLGGSLLEHNHGGTFFSPTILAGVAETSVGYLKEFFGPVLIVSSFDDDEEGLAMARHPVFALAASLYTDDRRKALSYPRRIDAGTVWVNSHGRAGYYAVPQGGFNGSGFGKEMGRLGIEAYVRQKTVWQSHE